MRTSFRSHGSLRTRLLAGFVSLMAAALGCVRAEDSPIEGGVAPNKRVEIRKVRVEAGPLRGSYKLELFDCQTNQSLSPLHQGGYFSYDEAVGGACAAFWHPSGRFAAVLNVEKQHVSSLFLFAVYQDFAKEIKMPDYALLALGKIKEGKQGFFEGPAAKWPEWIGDELHFKVVFKVPPPKKSNFGAPTEFTSGAVVTPVKRDGEYRAELKTLSHPERVP